MLKILFLSLALSWSQTPAPTESVTCLAGVLHAPVGVSKTYPLRVFNTQKLVLEPGLEQVTQSWPLLQIELDPKHAAFYSDWTLGPLGSMSPAESRILRSHIELERPPVQLTLSRFAETHERSAGMSIEIWVPGGFYAAYLVRPEIEGPHFSVFSPIRDLQDQSLWLGWVSLQCLVE